MVLASSSRESTRRLAGSAGCWGSKAWICPTTAARLPSIAARPERAVGTDQPAYVQRTVEAAQDGTALTRVACLRDGSAAGLARGHAEDCRIAFLGRRVKPPQNGNFGSTRGPDRASGNAPSRGARLASPVRELASPVRAAAPGASDGRAGASANSPCEPASPVERCASALPRRERQFPREPRSPSPAVERRGPRCASAVPPCEPASPVVIAPRVGLIGGQSASAVPPCEPASPV